MIRFFIKYSLNIIRFIFNKANCNVGPLKRILTFLEAFWTKNRYLNQCWDIFLKNKNEKKREKPRFSTKEKTRKKRDFSQNKTRKKEKK